MTANKACRITSYNVCYTKLLRLILMDGGHEVNEVFFDDVKVPVENLVYEENKGWTVAKYLLGHERMNTGRIGA